MNFVIFIGLIAALLTTISFLPQIIKTLKTKKTDDISLFMYILLSTGVFLWVVYGLITNDLPVILANAITFLFTLIMLVFKIKKK